MTLQEIVRDVYEALGEPSDLEYLDDVGVVDTALSGWQRMVDAVNRACLEISTWKFVDGRQLRFRFLEDNGLLKTEVYSTTIASGSTSSQVLVTDLPVQDDNYYAGMAIAIGTNTYRILFSRTETATTEVFLLTLPGSDPTGLTATVSNREYFFTDATGLAFGTFADGIAYIPANGTPLEILEITNLEDATPIAQEKKYNPVVAVTPSLSTPTMFYKITNGIRFNIWPDEELTYNVRYMRGPRVLAYTDTEVEPELPHNFHGAIVLHVLWWGYRRMQENNSAYATSKELVDMLRRLRTEYDLQGEFTTHQISFDMGV